MSKKKLERATKHNRVYAVFRRYKKKRIDGVLTFIPLYNIYRKEEY